MRILVDAMNLALAQGTGIATYARNICQANKESGNHVELLYEFLLPQGRSALEEEMAFYDPRYSYVSSRVDRVITLASVARQLAWPRPVKAEAVRLPGFVDTRALQGNLPPFDRIVTAPLIYRKAWAYFCITGRFLPVVCNPKPDIAHWTTPHPIYVPGARNVYTVHDVIPLKLPYTTLHKRRRFLEVIKGAVRHADQIISISDTTTRDLLAVAPQAAGKITNTLQSVALPKSLFTSDLDGEPALRNLFGLESKKFFLFYAAIEPKKNLSRLIEAFLSSNSPYPLILVGKKGWLYENELKPLGYLAARAQLSGSDEVTSRIVHLDYMSFALLMQLVKAARAVLFPSLYEGFGLPILEAMACGTPVMTSNTGAMKEIAQPGTAMLIDPLSIPEMTQAIERLASDDDLCARLSAAGLARAKDFGWDRYRAAVATAYDHALTAPRAVSRSP
jgi:glycosyltransferase involved in cell wall biosynthesis